MAWRYHGKASVDPDNPRTFAICDRCGALYNLCNLHWQMQWAGRSLINTKLLVCDRCLDVPAPFLRTLVLPPDPPAIMNARVEPYSIDEVGGWGLTAANAFYKADTTALTADASS